jgi:methyl-accepting chemotaxis protein
VKQTGQFTVFEGFPFVFNAFARFGGLVAAGETIVSAVKTSQRTPKTTPAAAGEVVATVAGTSPTAKTTRAAAETISSAVAKVVATFQTSPQTARTISRAAKTISSEDLQFVLGSATVPVAVVGVPPTTFVSELYLAGRQILHARRARSPNQN